MARKKRLCCGLPAVFLKHISMNLSLRYVCRWFGWFGCGFWSFPTARLRLRANCRYCGGSLGAFYHACLEQLRYEVVNLVLVAMAQERGLFGIGGMKLSMEICKWSKWMYMGWTMRKKQERLCANTTYTLARWAFLWTDSRNADWLSILSLVLENMQLSQKPKRCTKTINSVLTKENQASTSRQWEWISTFFIQDSEVQVRWKLAVSNFWKCFFWTGSDTRSEGVRSPPVQEEDVWKTNRSLNNGLNAANFYFGICFASPPENNSVYAVISDGWLHLLWLLMAFWLEFSSRSATISRGQGKLAPEWFGSTVGSLEQCGSSIFQGLPCWSLTVFGVGNSSTRPALAGHCAGRLQRRLETKQGRGNMFHPPAMTLMTGHCSQKGNRGVRLLQQHQRLGFSTKHEMAWNCNVLKHNLGITTVCIGRGMQPIQFPPFGTKLFHRWVALRMLRRLGRNGVHRSEDAPKAMWTRNVSHQYDAHVNNDWHDPMSIRISNQYVLLLTHCQCMLFFCVKAAVQVSLQSSALQVLSEPVPPQKRRTGLTCSLIGGSL